MNALKNLPKHEPLLRAHILPQGGFRDKSIGFVLLGLWLVMNIGLVMSLLGSLSGYLLPLTLLIIGIVLFWFAKR